ncbi:Small GTPase superfamily ARF type [Penicillium frequentans]|uniref:Small GTPase superfamily ARF type n=2 Tax=Penicillium TaxID=5073 RepID=A0AAD6GJ22_9EURO|nr:Small GTPase superfamily ARF type [Penicillium glabrum]KAJ5547003.1 Small GTPase superfamily ARF type [Penicillium glabrum]
MDASADTGLDTEEEVLGNDDAQGVFTFKLLEDETGVKVEVVGGAVKGDSEEELGSGVRRWEEWIGMCL